MGVGAHDPADAVAAAAEDGVEVAVVVGTGVDDDDLVDADEVGVGAGAGHHAGVGRQDPAHQRRERRGDAGHERLGGGGPSWSSAAGGTRRGARDHGRGVSRTSMYRAARRACPARRPTRPTTVYRPRICSTSVRATAGSAAGAGGSRRSRQEPGSEQQGAGEEDQARRRPPRGAAAHHDRASHGCGGARRCPRACTATRQRRSRRSGGRSSPGRRSRRRRDDHVELGERQHQEEHREDEHDHRSRLPAGPGAETGGSGWQDGQVADAEPRRLLQRLLPNGLLGLAALVFFMGLASAFTGAVLYAYYESRLERTEQDLEAFTAGYTDEFDAARAELQAEARGRPATHRRAARRARPVRRGRRDADGACWRRRSRRCGASRPSTRPARRRSGRRSWCSPTRSSRSCSPASRRCGRRRPRQGRRSGCARATSSSMRPSSPGTRDATWRCWRYRRWAPRPRLRGGRRHGGHRRPRLRPVRARRHRHADQPGRRRRRVAARPSSTTPPSAPPSAAARCSTPTARSSASRPALLPARLRSGASFFAPPIALAARASSPAPSGAASPP